MQSAYLEACDQGLRIIWSLSWCWKVLLKELECRKNSHQVVAVAEARTARRIMQPSSMNESLSIPIKSSSVDDKDDEEEDDDEEERRSSTSPANRAKDCKKKQHESKERVGGND